MSTPNPFKVNTDITPRLNVNMDSSFMVTVGPSRRQTTFTADVVDIVRSGDTTEYHLQNLNHNYSRRFTAEQLAYLMERGDLELIQF